MQIAVCTHRPDPWQVLPGLRTLTHSLHRREPDAAVALEGFQAVLVDATWSLHEARELCAELSRSHADAPLVVVEEGSLVAVDHRWGPVDLLLPTAAPTEIEFRLRMASARRRRRTRRTGRRFVGPLVLDVPRRVALLDGRRLEVTGKAFDLLGALAERPGEVHRREDLLDAVWGSRWYDAAGVDIQIRRVRLALGRRADAVVTVPRVGFLLDPDRLAAPLEPLPTDAGAEEPPAGDR